MTEQETSAELMERLRQQALATEESSRKLAEAIAEAARRDGGVQ
ncbi:hypothetical protein EES41_41075 (plasmid) [Streptomyces sp. ADI95-16]|nr:hypothetical protein [Streptomyces sp. ADI95-16]AYV33173.1 hypothetical protein EES41_41075 [Streptomyces sp. ADI95-16]